jgi:hypothetical protein
VIFEAALAGQLRGARDRHDPRLLGKEPGKRDLSRRNLLAFRDPAEQVDKRLVGFPSLRRKSREDVAEVGTVEGRVFVDLPREEAPAEGTVRNETDSEFLEGRQHFRFRPSRPQRVFALKRSDRLDGVGTTDRLHAGFREAEVLDLAFLDEVLHRSRHVFDRHVRVDAVLIEHIDRIDPEAPERALGDLLDVLRPAIQANPPRPALGIEFEPELGGDHHLSAERSEGFAHKFFVRERAVDFGGVEEGDAAIDGRPKECDHLLLVCRRAVRKAHSHAAEPDRRDFQVAFSEFAFLHSLLLCLSRDSFRSGEKPCRSRSGTSHRTSAVFRRLR